MKQAKAQKMYCYLMTFLLLLHIVLVFQVSAIIGILRPARVTEYKPKPESSIKHHQYFHILTDSKEVEKNAVRYAQSRHNNKGKLLGWKSNLSWRADLCSTSSPDLRIDFCQQAIRADYYGFQFDLESYKHSACQLQDFWTKSLVSSEPGPFQLEMFSCPPIFHEDTEIGADVFLPYTYAVSRGESRKSAFLFVQEETSDVKYPLEYINNISFHTLKDGKKMQSLIYWESLLRQKFSTKSTQRFYTEQEGRPYEKFRSRFNSLNVCGLRRKHRILICRSSIEEQLGSKHLALQTEGYNANCQKHRINSTSRRSVASRKELRVLLCPPIVSYTRENKLTDEGSYYVSTNVSSNAITLFHRQNIRGQKLKFLDSQVYRYADMARMLRDIQRDRFIPYPPEDERTRRAGHKSVAQIIEEMKEPRSATDRRQKRIRPKKRDDDVALQNAIFNLNRLNGLKSVWLAEDLIISFSKIKTTTPVYRRFMDTYHSTGLCELSERQHRSICNHVAITKTKRPGTKYKFDREQNITCQRRQVILKAREAEDLETDNFAMRQCPYSEDSSLHPYFVGKSHLKDTAILYRSFLKESKKEFHPHAVYLHEVIIDINTLH